jgi:cytochrome o ubiquinol oxidase subunit 2
MHFQVHALPADEFAAWISARRGTGPTLDAESYAALARQSLNTPPSTFGSVDPGLFHEIVTQKLPPGPGPVAGRPDASVSPRTGP